ncbi:nitrate/nitrite two-component system sensor histidine kinase NarQ [Enterovibrio paralichthyis]|uniref:nitrate/nitrite two-component system sensor histidine kinase NarQ n=1 Tax=Enterovibrio paralichthyis TaxID=2853805 RepID=UPI001C4906E7|nr:nitrate/nitrite two-component system sensor histidine kinase NarQ [Enterovibrio paralichthyis]MBV7299419.1 nitrate/nitrite two-component system sensor histidine kinase NarQ [Enterovibrio paralichthyis]
MTAPTHNITVRHSVITIVARSLIGILSLAVIITGFALFTLASSLNDAAAINTAGSLRMQSYRIAYDIVLDSPRYQNHIVSFEQSLTSPELQILDNFAVPREIRERYHSLLERWVVLRPELESEDRGFYVEQVALFVNDIDRFVYALQEFSENKLQVLALVGSLSLGLILALVLFLLHYTQRRIVNPLNLLVTASQRIQNRDFHIELPPSRSNELGVLSNSFAIMASELEELYSNLEQKIESETQKLTKANRSLNLLYDCSTLLSSTFLTRERFEKILDITLNMDGVDALSLSAHNPNQSDWEITAGEPTKAPWHTLPLMLDGESLGTLKWQGDEDTTDSVLLTNLAAILARGVYYNHAQKQAMHLAVMEERATLARELHDSIAQSLSYLKIQTSLLKRHLKQLDAPDANEIAEEISDQLRIAYDQLRELLNAFRLSLTHADFGLALQEMLDALQSQTEAEIRMVSSLDTLSIDAQRQMHILQIIREACANAIKHAHANQITVSCIQHNHQASIAIVDDGVGFSLQEEKPDHYGLNIMQERSAMLGGELKIITAPSEGCQVRLTFDLN